MKKGSGKAFGFVIKREMLQSIHISSWHLKQKGDASSRGSHLAVMKERPRKLQNSSPDTAEQLSQSQQDTYLQTSYAKKINPH